MSTTKEAPPTASGSSAAGDVPVSTTPPNERTIRASIKKFANLTQTLSSQLHNIRGINWRMSVMPKTYTTPEKETKKCLGFFVQCSPENPYSDNWSCKADAEMRMVSMKSGIPHFIRKANNHVYTPKETDWGFTCFMSWADILDESRGFIKDDEVVVEVTIRPDPPKNTMTREEFIVIIDKWYNLAEIQMSKGKTDLAIEANNQAIKFCKNKDEETKQRLEVQKEELMKKKMLDCINRIETGDVPSKILKPRFLRQPVTKNVSKVAVSKNAVKRSPKPPPQKSPVKEEPKFAEEPRKVVNEVPTPPVVHQQPPPSTETFEYSETSEAEEQDVAPEDMSLPGSDVCECDSQISHDDLPSVSSLENDEVFLPVGGPMGDEELAKLVKDLEDSVSTNDFRGYFSASSSRTEHPVEYEQFSQTQDIECSSTDNADGESSSTDSEYEEEQFLQNFIEAKCNSTQIIPFLQEKVIEKCHSIIENLRDFTTHANGVFEDGDKPSMFQLGDIACGPRCELEGKIKSSEAAIAYNNRVMLHLAQQFILSVQPTKDSMEEYKKSLTLLAQIEGREERVELLKTKLAEEKALRSEVKKEVTTEKAKVRVLCEETAVENRELKAVTKELGKMERMGDGLERKNVELTNEVEELKMKLLLAEQQTKELKKNTAVADAKVKKEAKKDASVIRKLKTDRVESQKVKDAERNNWMNEIKGLQEKEAARKEEQMALAAAIAEAEQRARAAEVAQVRLKGDFVLSTLEMTRRKAEVGMRQANDNMRLARTEADRTVAQRNFKAWCHALDEVKSLLQVTKCDYDCAEGMIKTGAKTLADVEFPERPTPKLPKNISPNLAKFQEIKPISIPPPEIRTPAAGVIGQPRTPKTAEPAVSLSYTPLNGDSDSEQPSSPWTWPSPSVLQTSYSASSVTWNTNDQQEKAPTPDWQTPRREVPRSRRF